LVVQAGFQVTSVTHMQAVVSVIKIILEWARFFRLKWEESNVV
jgi:hypothetical protein